MKKNWIDNGVPKEDIMELVGVCVIIDDKKSIIELTGGNQPPFMDIQGELHRPQSIEIQVGYINKDDKTVSLKLRSEV